MNVTSKRGVLVATSCVGREPRLEPGRRTEREKSSKNSERPFSERTLMAGVRKATERK